MRLIIILISTGVLASGCGASPGGARGTEKVVASFYPLAFAAEQVGGKRVHVTNLTPPGAEPHDLEVSPQQVQDLESAGLVLLLGHGFQPQLEDAAGSGSKVLRLLDTPGLGRSSDGDPHVWLDPVRYAIVVKRIGAALGAPRAADRLVARLRALDAALRAGLAHCTRHEIVTSHAAFSYLAERYRLRQLAITGLVPEAEPTPGALQRVVSAVRRSGATTVFFEPLVSPRIAQTVARETGAHTAVLDPIEGLTSTEASAGQDYFSRMRANLAALRKALRCR
jgi:zinc transport system substrate-binding protein